MNAQQKLGLDLFPELMNPVIENLVPEPKEPYGTIAFDVPEDILDVEQLDSNNRLAEGMTVKDLMSQILNRVRWIAIAPDELPEMMLSYYQ